MKIYKLSQNENNGWDTYDGIIVCAESAKDAATIHPYGEHNVSDKNWVDENGSWCSSPKEVEVEYLGEAGVKQKRGVILSSFNAG